jgi:hypothetical protein
MAVPRLIRESSAHLECAGITCLQLLAWVRPPCGRSSRLRRKRPVHDVEGLSAAWPGRGVRLPDRAEQFSSAVRCG